MDDGVEVVFGDKAEERKGDQNGQDGKWWGWRTGCTLYQSREEKASSGM